MCRVRLLAPSEDGSLTRGQLPATRSWELRVSAWAEELKVAPGVGRRGPVGTGGGKQGGGGSSRQQGGWAERAVSMGGGAWGGAERRFGQAGAHGWLQPRREVSRRCPASVGASRREAPVGREGAVKSHEKLLTLCITKKEPKYS